MRARKIRNAYSVIIMAMEITVQNDAENPFLERRDVKFTVTSDGATPKANDLRAALATKLNVPDKNILIEHIYQKMGLHESDCIAKVYKKPVVAEKEGESKEGEEVKQSEPADSASVDDTKAEPVAEEKKDAPAAEKQPEEAKEVKKEDAKAEEPATKEVKEEKKE